MLAGGPGEGGEGPDVDAGNCPAGHAGRDCDSGGGGGEPAVADAEWLGLPEDAVKPGDEPDGERGPKVRPGVHGVAGVPEQQAEVGDDKDDVQGIEGLVEAVADGGQRGDADAKEDCERWHTGVLGMSVSGIGEEEMLAYLVGAGFAIYIELQLYLGFAARYSIPDAANKIRQTVEQAQRKAYPGDPSMQNIQLFVTDTREERHDICFAGECHENRHTSKCHQPASNGEGRRSVSDLCAVIRLHSEDERGNEHDRD